MKIRAFGVEIWMNRYETQCGLNLAETCIESLTISELLQLSGRNEVSLAELLPMKMTYGAIGANALVYETLVEPGGRVISVLPTCRQHYLIHRDYNIISIGMLDDHFAALALENRDKILARSQRVTSVKPQSGTTALLKYDADMTSEEFCVRLLEETGVMLTPGSAMDMEGYLRIGYANGAGVLKAGLARISAFLAKLPARAVAQRVWR